MIPFAILSGQIKIEEQGLLEIRVMELASDYFTFRLPKSFLKKTTDVKGVALRFFSGGKLETGVELSPECFELYPDAKEEFFDVYRVRTAQEDYRQAVRLLTGKYMEYVEGKLTLEDAELSEKLVGYPAAADREFAQSIEQQKQIWSSEVLEGLQDGNWGCFRNRRMPELAVLLGDESLVRSYLEKSMDDFWSDYWNEWKLAKHPLAKCKLTHLYIGNSFCPLLLPEVEVCRKILEKAAAEWLQPVFVLAPIPESRWNYMQRWLRQVHEILEQMDLYAELEVNDEGIEGCKYTEGFSRFQIRRGVLLAKKRKDPRMKYLSENGMAKISDSLDLVEGGVYIPFYQTNTATFCTMYSSLTEGERGRQSRVKSCPQFCRDHFFLYPKHLHMLGRYNSLLGMNVRSLQEWDAVADTVDMDCCRVILNL